MHYLLFYEKAPGYAERQKPFSAAHLAYVQDGVRRGLVVLGGSLEDPDDGTALQLLDAGSLEAVEAYALGDPYVIEGVVSAWRVRKWPTVVGAQAATPLF